MSATAPLAARAIQAPPPATRATSIARAPLAPPFSAAEDTYEGPRSPARPRGDGRIVLLYNGECAVCRKISGWVMRSDDPAHGGRQAIDERPIGHDPDAVRALHPDLDIWEAYEKIHVVLPDGTIKKGGDAVAEVLSRLPGTAWMSGLFDLDLFGFRPFLSLVRAGYHVLDRLRPALGCESCGTPVPWWGKPIAWVAKLFIRNEGPEAQPH